MKVLTILSLLLTPVLVLSQHDVLRLKDRPVSFIIHDNGTVDGDVIRCTGCDDATGDILLSGQDLLLVPTGDRIILTAISTGSLGKCTISTTIDGIEHDYSINIGEELVIEFPRGQICVEVVELYSRTSLTVKSIN